MPFGVGIKVFVCLSTSRAGMRSLASQCILIDCVFLCGSIFHAECAFAGEGAV